jgi:transcriptional regulator with XRE-family HTH domain
MIGQDRRLFHREAFSRKVREERDRLGMTQDQLAESLEVDRRQIVRLEHGGVPPTPEVIEAVARVLGVPTLVFFQPTVQSSDPTNDELRASSEWAEREIKSRYIAAIERERIVRIVRWCASLPDQNLAHIEANAQAFNQALQWHAPAAALNLMSRAAYTPMPANAISHRQRAEARARTAKARRSGSRQTRQRRKR